MGNSQSDSQPDSELHLPEGVYSFNRPFDDLRYGAVQVYSLPSNESFVAKCSKLDNGEQEHERRRADAEFAATLKHPNLIEVRKVDGMKKSEACSTFYVLNVYAQFLFYGLDKEILRRKEYNEGFAEEEVWYAGHSVLGAVDYLASKGVYHEDVRPLNVLIENDGSIRLFWNNALRPGFNQFVKLSSNEGDDECYLSPKLFGGLKGSGVNNNDPVKSDVYSTGMVLLEMVSNVGVKECYDYNGWTVREEEIDRRLDACKTSYSPQCLQWIREMLIHDEGKRQDPAYFVDQVPNAMKNARIRLPNQDKPSAQSVQVHSPAKQEVVHREPEPTIEQIQPNMVQSHIEHPQTTLQPAVNSVSRSRLNPPPPQINDPLPQIQYNQPPPPIQSYNYNPQPLDSNRTFTNNHSHIPQHKQGTLDFLYLNKDYNEPVTMGGHPNPNHIQSENITQKTENSYIESGLGQRKFRDYYNYSNQQQVVSPVRSAVQVQPPQRQVVQYVQKPLQYQAPAASHHHHQTQSHQYVVPLQQQNHHQHHNPLPSTNLNYHQSHLPVPTSNAKPFGSNLHSHHHTYQNTYSHTNHQESHSHPSSLPYPTKTYDSPIVSKSARKDFLQFNNSPSNLIHSNLNQFTQKEPTTSIERHKLGPIIERDQILRDIDRVNVDQIIQEVKSEQRKRLYN